MDYLLLNSVFTLGAGVLVLLARKAFKLTVVAPVFVALAVVTLIADNFIVGLGIVDYDPAKILGFRLGLAPIEDWGYLLVGVFLVPVIYRFAQRYVQSHKPIDLTGDDLGPDESGAKQNG